MSDDEIIADAEPAKHFAFPPYRAELFNPENGWSGVMNRAGFNCLYFRTSPGTTITRLHIAQAIAERWNAQEKDPA